MQPFVTAFMLTLAASVTAQGKPPEQNWQEVVTKADRQHLRDWRTAFTRALEQARADDHSAEIAREGALLEPDSAIGGPIANGDYYCRVIKLGAQNKWQLSYIAYPAFRCRIDDGGVRQQFTKLTGSQRPVGLIYPADQLRGIFLGTMVLGDETTAYQYGVDAERDLAGWVERIGDQRWRIIFPYPNYGSTLDIMELVSFSQEATNGP